MRLASRNSYRSIFPLWSLSIFSKRYRAYSSVVGEESERTGPVLLKPLGIAMIGEGLKEQAPKSGSRLNIKLAIFISNSFSLINFNRDLYSSESLSGWAVKRKKVVDFTTLLSQHISLFNFSFKGCKAKRISAKRSGASF